MIAGDPADRSRTVVVVDNGSRDRTADVARAAAPAWSWSRVGGTGRPASRGSRPLSDADVIAFLDADHSDYPAQLVDVLAPILAGEADLVIGSRSLGRRARGRTPATRSSARGCASGLMNALIGTRATDLGPFRAITADGPPRPRDARPQLRLDRRDAGEGGAPRPARARGAGGLPAADRPEQGERHRLGDRARGRQDPRHHRAPRASAAPDERAASGCSPPGVAYGCVAAWADAGEPDRPHAIVPRVCRRAFAAYLASPLDASRASLRRGLWPPSPSRSSGGSPSWPRPPLLSDDVYRYRLGGADPASRREPVRWADRPEAARWEALRDDVWERVNHKDYTAIYPPLWQLVARGVVAIRDSVAAMKAFVVACEIGDARRPRATCCALRGLPRERLLVAAWSPLALVEIAGSGHNDPLGLLFLALALLALEAKRPLSRRWPRPSASRRSCVPGLIAASWWRRYRWHHVAAAGLLAALLVVPYAGARQGLWRSLGSYGRYWRFNETLFAPLAAALRRPRGGRGRHPRSRPGARASASRASSLRRGLVVVARVAPPGPERPSLVRPGLASLPGAVRRAGGAALHRDRGAARTSSTRAGWPAERGRWVWPVRCPRVRAVRRRRRSSSGRGARGPRDRRRPDRLREGPASGRRQDAPRSPRSGPKGAGGLLPSPRRGGGAPDDAARRRLRAPVLLRPGRRARRDRGLVSGRDAAWRRKARTSEPAWPPPSTRRFAAGRAASPSSAATSRGCRGRSCWTPSVPWRARARSRSVPRRRVLPPRPGPARPEIFDGHPLEHACGPRGDAGAGAGPRPLGDGSWSLLADIDTLDDMRAAWPAVEPILPAPLAVLLTEALAAEHR